MSIAEPVIRHLGQREYETVWRDMQKFTQQRHAQSQDELWIVEHPPVYTLGLNGKAEHILENEASPIPVVESDRGGQVTYHGPGQLVIYVLLDIKRLKIGVKELVSLLEQCILDLLSMYSLKGERKESAPGVYVYGEKISALGLRIKRGCSYHGLSLNVDMDLEPFTHINPCGYKELHCTQLSKLLPYIDMELVIEQLTQILITRLYSPMIHNNIPSTGSQV